MSLSVELARVQRHRHLQSFSFFSTHVACCKLCSTLGTFNLKSSLFQHHLHLGLLFGKYGLSQRPLVRSFYLIWHFILKICVCLCDGERGGFTFSYSWFHPLFLLLLPVLAPLYPPSLLALLTTNIFLADRWALSPLCGHLV